VIRLISAHSVSKGYWAMAEELDALDRDLAPTAHEHFGLEHLVRATSASTADVVRARAYKAAGKARTRELVAA